MSRPGRAALVATLLLALAPACTRSRTGEQQEGFRSITDVQVTLIVENQRMEDYTVYLARGGGVRIGLVNGPSTARFLLKGDLLPHTGDLRIFARAVGSSEVVSASANVPHGRTVRMRILPNDVYMLVDPLPPDTTATPDSTTPPDSTKPRATSSPGSPR